MSEDLSQEKRGAPLSSQDQNNSGAGRGQGNEKQETPDGQYKNVETSVNNRSYFDDDYEVGQEDEMSREEAKTEDENNVTKGRRADEK